MYDVITIGSATRDVFMMSKALHPHRAPDALSHIEACFPFGAKINVDEIFFSTGGGATNNAVTFSRLGKLRTAAICRIGADSAGREVREGLTKDRVRTDFIQTARDLHEHTAYSTILSPGGEVGERTILVYRGASRKIEHARIPWTRLNTRWFHLSSLGGDLLLLKKILGRAKKIGARVAMNPGGQEINRFKKSKTITNQLAVLIVNREEAAALTGAPFKKEKDLLRSLAGYAPAAIMTDGPKGAYAVVRETGLAYYVPSVGHAPRNLTGAGDAFGSGFVTGLIRSHNDWPTALQLAAFNADSVVQYLGAKTGILKRAPSATQLHTLHLRPLTL